jgi:NitT/TauT family transport system substrate-binding protein
MPRIVNSFAIATAVMAMFSGAAASSPNRALVTITVDTLPIANALPMDLGIKKGFFQAQGIEISKRTLQSGNDIVLALANHNGEIGYLGWVPMMIARTQGIKLSAVAASEVEGTSANDNWQNILVKGSSSIRTAKDLAGKTIAVNALKGVGEVMIKAALKKEGVDPNSIKLLALPFPSMRSALQNGQVDAIWTPEPFLSQALNTDGARIVMAPGPVLGKFWPIGGYAALGDWSKSNPDLARKFRTAINQSLTYSQSHPSEIRTSGSRSGAR